jgi:phenylalanyl-tRNA synthetase beta chain
VPRSPHIGALSRRQRDRRAVRSALVELPDAGITIANPLVAEESVLRTSLLPGLLKALAYNASHRNPGVGLFEVGHIFRVPAEPQELPDEREFLAVARAGVDASAAVEAWGYVVDALGIADAAIETATAPGVHPTRAAHVSVGGEVVGVAGEVDPTVLARFGVPERVAWLEVDIGRLLDVPHGERPYRLVSRYPSSDIDLAFEVDESIPAGAVAAQLQRAAGDLLARLDLFDVYRGPQVASGTRSLAYALRLQATDRTLTDAEVADVRRAVIDAVEGELPAKLRR